MTAPIASSTTLRPPWRGIARAVWLVMATSALALFVIGMLHSVQVSPPSCAAAGASCMPGEVTLEDLAHAEKLGVPASVLVLTGFGATLLARLGMFLTGVLIFRLRSSDWVALALSLALVGSLLEGGFPGMGALSRGIDVWNVVGGLAWVPLPFVFPNGRHEPRFTRFITLPLGLAVVTSFTFAPSHPLSTLLTMAWLVLSTGAMVYRYRRTPVSREKQQLKWVSLGMACSFVAGTTWLVLARLFPPSQPSAARLVFLFAEAGVYVASYWGLAVCFGVALLRYRLWDVDVVLNRALVYGILTAAVVSAYVLLVGTASALLQKSGSLLVSLLATGLIALAVNPLRARLQASANRWMYGERDDPYRALSRFARRLETTLLPDSVLLTIVETIAHTLRVPYVAIRLSGASAPATSFGSPTLEPWALPLRHGQEDVGELLVAPRSLDEAFTGAERRLLEDIALQAGVAVNAARLTRELTDARERLVTAREEERRRLRRDLHDGLGPKLAGQALILESVRDALASGSESRALVDHLLSDSQAIVSEIRRLVHGLRPPVLDELGLVGAVRAQAAESERSGLRVLVQAPAPAPPLPAAVEVAAYRIVQEALTNVVRHARASACEVRLSLGESALSVEVEDDGVGLSPARSPGVGLSSMRERAEEIRGTCAIGEGVHGGTRVFASLPLHPRTGLAHAGVGPDG